MAIYSGFLICALIIYICGDYIELDMGVLSGTSRGERFVCSTTMILLTIGLLPLSLRFFKFKHVSDDLMDRKEEALVKWGSMRITVLGVLLVVNTFLYYAFEFESAYGYLAVVTLLCMPFVLPTMNRCASETSAEPDVPDDSE